jgi:CRISPR-associated protein Cas5d
MASPLYLEHFMTTGITLHVAGPRALFSRPEMKVERVSYDVLTPSAARGILEAIHWKPAIRWQVNRITVLNPIRFESVRRNEVGSRIPSGKVGSAMKAGSTEGLALYVDEDRQQRAATILRDVAYLIDATFEMTGKAGPEDNAGKHLDIFNRRARKGQCFHRPCLGTREFAADFSLVEGDRPRPHDLLMGERDLGWMALDIDYANGNAARFFRATMRDGVVKVPPVNSAEVVQ